MQLCNVQNPSAIGIPHLSPLSTFVKPNTSNFRRARIFCFPQNISILQGVNKCSTPNILESGEKGEICVSIARCSLKCQKPCYHVSSSIAYSGREKKAKNNWEKARPLLKVSLCQEWKAFLNLKNRQGKKKKKLLLIKANARYIQVLRLNS